MKEYDRLLAKVRKRNPGAAATLEPLARERQDEGAVLACWRISAPGRARAWQALRAAFNSLGPMPDAPNPRDSGETAVVQRALIAQLLVDRCKVNSTGDELEALMLEVSEVLFKAPMNSTAKERVGEGLDRIPVAPDLRTSLLLLERIRETLNAFVAASIASAG